MSNDKEVRIQKLLANYGIASRRKLEKLILIGRIKIDGNVAHLGQKVNYEKCTITIDDVPIKYNNIKKIYIMLYKPRGFITTMHDQFNRKSVVELVKDIPERIFPVGRLDKNTEGLLLMTNDGEFANTIAHPSKHVFKTYRVTIKNKVTPKHVELMSDGIFIDNRKTLPAKVKIISEYENRTILEVSITEGRNRQIRKMCEQLNLEIAKLKRISIGDLKLGMLKPGRWRFLNEEEVNSLKYLKNEINY